MPDTAHDEIRKEFKRSVANGEKTRESGNIDEAVQIFRDILPKTLSGSADRALVLNHMGLCYEHAGTFAAASACYKEAHDISKQLADWSNLARAKRHLSSLYVKLGDLDSAQTYVLQSREILDNLDERPADAVWFTHGVIKVAKAIGHSKEDLKLWIAVETQDLLHAWKSKTSTQVKLIWTTGWMTDVAYVWGFWGWVVIMPVIFLIAVSGGLGIRLRQMLGLIK